MSKKIDKDMLKNPDVFVSTSDKVFNFVEHHFLIFATVVCAALAGSVAYVGYGYYASSKEQKASEALYTPEAELKKAESNARDEQAKLVKDLAGNKKTVTPPKAKPVDFAKEYAPVVEKVKAAIRAHADTKSALVSALNLSYFLAQQKQFTAAQEVLELPSYRPGPGELLTGFWQMHRGLTYLENNNADQAISAYQAVLAADALKPFHAEALLKLGICFEIKGDKNKARENYERVGRDFPETEASTSAQQYLRLLQLGASSKG